MFNTCNSLTPVYVLLYLCKCVCVCLYACTVYARAHVCSVCVQNSFIVVFVSRGSSVHPYR